MCLVDKAYEMRVVQGICSAALSAAAATADIAAELVNTTPYEAKNMHANTELYFFDLK